MSHACESSVLDLWRRIDGSTRALSEFSGLACPSGCGRCCTSPEVECTELELRPLARAMWAAGSAERWLARLANFGTAGICTLYEPEPGDADRGRCAHYELRPSVCRLFGFAARRDRRGERVLAACKVHREIDAEAVARADAAIAGGLEVLEHSSTASALEGSRLLPINAALQRALQHVGFELQLASEEARAAAPEPPEEQPPRPFVPHRAA